MTKDQAKRRIFIGLCSLIPETSWQQSNLGSLFALAQLGTSDIQVLVHVHEEPPGIFVLLNFDEDQVIQISHRTGLTITELLSPYIVALETVEGSNAIGIGFELSPPSGEDDQSLKDAGIAQFFVWDADNAKWIRRELLPMVGHYL